MRNLYEIAVSLTMVNHSGAVLSTIAHQFIGIHGHINAATAASTRFRTALIAAGAALASGGLLSGMAQIVNHGAEFARVIDRMRLAGWSAGEIRHATTHAFDLARQFPSLPASFLMEMQREMAPVLGSREEATHVAGSLAQLMRVLEIHRGPGQTAALHTEIIAAVRAGELSANTLTDTRFREFLDLMVPSINAWGGLVTPRDLAQFFQYARQSGIGLSDRFIRDVAPTLIQEMRASGTGTAFQTMMQAMVGGRMTLRALNAWNDLGLVDRSLIQPGNLTPEGRLRRIQPGLIVQNELLRSDPDRWAHSVLVPALIRAGRFTEADWRELAAGNLRAGQGIGDYTGGERARVAIQEELYRLFGDRTGQGLMGAIIEQIRKIERDAVLVKDYALRLGQSQETINQNYGMALAGVRGSWQTLNEALALPNMQSATRGLNMLSGALGSITHAILGLDPSTVNSISLSVGAFVAIVFGGAIVALLGVLATFIGWPVIIGAAIIGALVGIGTYIYQNWGEIGEYIKLALVGIGTALLAFFFGIPGLIAAGLAALGVYIYNNEWVRSIASKIGEGLLAIPGMLGDAIAGMASRIAAAIRGMFSGQGALFTGGRGRTPEAPGTPSIGDFMVPQSWVPPPSQSHVVPIRHELTIDGHKIGEAVSHYIAIAATHVQSAAGFDGGLSYAPVDMQMA